MSTTTLIEGRQFDAPKQPIRKGKPVATTPLKKFMDDNGIGYSAMLELTGLTPSAFQPLYYKGATPTEPLATWLAKVLEVNVEAIFPSVKPAPPQLPTAKEQERQRKLLAQLRAEKSRITAGHVKAAR